MPTKRYSKNRAFFVKNMPNLVHSSKCVWVTMVTVYGTTSLTPKRMHVIIWDQIDVPARFHCEKVKLLGLGLEAGASRTCSGRPRTGAVPTKRAVLVNPVLVRTNQTRPYFHDNRGMHEYIYTKNSETRYACFENLKYPWQLVGESFKNANLPVVECSRVNPHSHFSRESLAVKPESGCRVNRL